MTIDLGKGRRRRQMAVLQPKRRRIHANIAPLLLAFSCSSMIIKSVRADICFLLYQNADNQLEYTQRRELRDYISSEAIKDPTVTSWVYFDAYNTPSPEPLAPSTSSATTSPAGTDEADAKRSNNIPFIKTPLEGVWTKDGSQLLTDASSSKYEGSLYLTFDHADHKMKIDKELEGEQNSDDPATLWGFVGYSIQHCMARNATDTFLIIDGIGAGSFGIGGDDNKGVHDRKQRKRRLENPATSNDTIPATTSQPGNKEKDLTKLEPPEVESHADIVMALKSVLDDLPEGGPKKFSVIGFDGNFMQTFNVVNDYKEITDHVLASESLVPEHGWSLETLSDTLSAKAMAQQIVRDFTQKPHNANGIHSTPKTLSLVDTKEKFPIFVQAFNEYLGAMAQKLKEEKDLSAFVYIHRARSEAITYAKDLVVDMGSFFGEFDMLCHPKDDADIDKKSKAAKEAYQAMFVEREFGPGTMKGTGMIIDLPTIHGYRDNPKYWSALLRLKDYRIMEIDQYIPFYRAYLQSKIPAEDDGQSICRGDAAKNLLEEIAAAFSDIQPFPEGMFQLAPPYGDRTGYTDPTGEGINGAGLFKDPQILESSSEVLRVSAQLDAEATTVDAMFGLNATNLLEEAKAKWAAEYGNTNARRTRFLRRNLAGGNGENGFTVMAGGNKGNDFIIMYGGTAPGKFENSEESDYDFAATWDRKFYFINDSIYSHPIHVYEQEVSGAARSVEVVFFEPNTAAIKDARTIKPGTTIKEAEDTYGGQKGYMEFSFDEASGEASLSLYVCLYRNKMTGFNINPLTGLIDTGKVCAGEYNQRPRDNPGLVAPVIPVRGLVYGELVVEGVGGPEGKVFEWSEQVDLQVQAMKDVDFQKDLGAEGLVMELVAESYDSQRRDIHTFHLAEGRQNANQEQEDEQQEDAEHPQEEEDPNRGHGSVTTMTREEDAKQQPDDNPNRGNGSITQNELYDIAKCKPAIQSSTADGNFAQLALTGEEAKLAHTACEVAPWWMVDLFETRPIDSVVIVNRKDCCQERLDGVLVELLDNNDETLTSLKHNPEVDGALGDQWQAKFDNQKARKVRVSITVNEEEAECGFLNLAVVQVLSNECKEKDSCREGVECDYGDVALCKPADQSTTLDLGGESVDLGAYHAVDGTQLLSHTSCDQKPWWEVDLLRERPVSDVVIKNREDCCFERLDGLKVQLLDDKGQLTGLFEHNPAEGGSIKPMLIVHFDKIATRKVRLSIDHEEGQCGVLNIEELQVYSDCIAGVDTCRTEALCTEGT